MGILGDIKIKQLKNKNTIAYTTLEDTAASIDVIMFSATIEKYRPLMNENSIVIIHGKVSEHEDREPELICEAVEEVPESAKITEQTATLYLRVDSIGSVKFNLVCDTLAKHKGDTDVIIVCTDTGKRIMAPDRLKITRSDRLLNELYQILGKNNVKLVIK